MRSLALFCLFVVHTTSAEFVSMEPETFDERLEKARNLLSEVPLIDGHNDLAMNIHDLLKNQLSLFPFDQNLTQLEPWASDVYSHTDLQLLREGQVSAQFWAAWVPCATPPEDMVVKGLEQIDVIRRLVDRYPDDLQWADSPKGIIDAFANDKLASLIGVEGGHMINSSLAVLRLMYASGARYLTLTHSCSTPWAGSSTEEENVTTTVGLTNFGKLVITEMNRLGMMVDLAHSSEQTMNDVLEATAAPVIISHTGVFELCNSSRNVKDEVLEKLKINGGITLVSFYPLMLSCSTDATIHDVIDTINHIKNVSGVDHVGLGSDYNGINLVPEGLENVSKFPQLFAELLLDPEWTDQNLKKLAGMNFLRVFQLVDSVKDVLVRKNPVENTFVEKKTTDVV